MVCKVYKAGMDHGLLHLLKGARVVASQEGTAEWGTEMGCDDKIVTRCVVMYPGYRCAHNSAYLFFRALQSFLFIETIL